MSNGVSRLEMGSRAYMLEKLYQRYRSDQDPFLAELMKVAGGRFVPGLGSLAPQVVFVGEAPGSTEHNTGRPFAGPSGKILNELIESIGLDRDKDCFVTNAVHYRPVNKFHKIRSPEPAEVDASRQYLMKEIGILRPRVVVTLGRVPMAALVRYPDSISACHGKQARKSQCYVSVPVLTMFHPAVGVYQQSRKPMLVRDFQNIRRFL